MTAPEAPSTPDPAAGATASVSSNDRRTRRRGLVAGLSAGLLGGAAVGLVVGVPGSTSAADGDAGVANALAQVDDAGANDATADADRLTARTERIRSGLDELVTNGAISAEQADTVAAHLAEQAPTRGPGGHGGPGGPRGHRIDGEVLELLGIDAAEPREELRSGATLAEIAEANGVSSDELVAVLVDKASERLDEAVANGRLDEAEAAEKLDQLTDRITDRVDGSAGTDG